MGKPFPINFEIRFIDSFKFLQTSLSNLVKNLQSTDFKNLNKAIKHNSSLLTRKGVYPYDYVISIDKLKETKFPSKEDFYSKLYDEEISDEDYQHAINVWKTFNCQTLQDYHDLYLKLMFSFLQTYLKISEKLVSNITNLIQVIIIQLLVLLGMHVSKKQNKNFSFLKIMAC